MKAQDFTYWLQGFFELSESETLSEAQVDMIKSHLALVFNKVTPDIQKTPLVPTGDILEGEELQKVLRDLYPKESPFVMPQQTWPDLHTQQPGFDRLRITC